MEIRMYCTQKLAAGLGLGALALFSVPAYAQEEETSEGGQIGRAHV